MIIREEYIEQILPYIDKPFVKVITGIRRSGKSELMKSLIERFQTNCITKDRIIYINFESFVWEHIKTATDLYNYITEHKHKNLKTYIFLDEVQGVKGWERVVNSVMVDYDVDIYITGSNSRLLSSELSTYLTGRFVDIVVRPLSFKEYFKFHSLDLGTDRQEKIKEFNKYLRLGGFPALNIADYDLQDVYKIVYDIYSSIILRDTVQRNNIRNIDVLERIIRYIFNNVGNIISAKSISDYFKSQNRKIDSETIYNYIQYIKAAFVVEKIQRYDIKGKEVLTTNEKYFASDLSLIYSLLGFNPRNIGGYLENLVCLQLKRLGYDVYVGKEDDREVDFVAIRKDEKLYVQVAYKIESDKTLEREITPLLTIKDNYPKYLVTTDELLTGNINGIQTKHIAEFLLEIQ